MNASFARALPVALVVLIPVIVAFRNALPARSEEIPTYGRFSTAEPLPADGAVTAAQLSRGRVVYEMLCQACHMPDGGGMGSALPPLAGADYLLEDRVRAARIVLHGLSGPITVNGLGFNAAMPALGGMLTDQQVADVLTFVFNSWGNTGPAFSAHQIRNLR